MVQSIFRILLKVDWHKSCSYIFRQIKQTRGGKVDEKGSDCIKARMRSVEKKCLLIDLSVTFSKLITTVIMTEFSFVGKPICKNWKIFERWKWGFHLI